MLQSVNLRDYIIANPIRVHPQDSILDAMQVIEHDVGVLSHTLWD